MFFTRPSILLLPSSPRRWIEGRTARLSGKSEQTREIRSSAAAANISQTGGSSEDRKWIGEPFALLLLQPRNRSR